MGPAMNSATLVQERLNHCNIVRDAGMSPSDDVEQFPRLPFVDTTNAR